MAELPQPQPSAAAAAGEARLEIESLYRTHDPHKLEQIDELTEEYERFKLSAIA